MYVCMYVCMYVLLFYYVWHVCMILSEFIYIGVICVIVVLNNGAHLYIFIQNKLFHIKRVDVELASV